MNWELFYFINRQFLDMMLLGLFYTITLGGLFLVIKLLLDNMKGDDND